MDLSDLSKVWEIKTLKKIGEEDAYRILEKVAKQVQPIMHKRLWKVQLLSEFSPANPSLMGLNIGGGLEIKLRLRTPKSDWNFFPYEQILDTMLHELCHNAYGPHNADFYNLLDEIRKECEDLVTKGITGTGKGFDLPGRRLGGFSCQAPPLSCQQAAIEAAENRVQRSKLMPPGPNRVGGDGNIKALLSPTQAAAMAAERRLHDDFWCGSESSDSTSNSDRTGEVSYQPSSSSLSKSLQAPDNLYGNDEVASNREQSWQCDVCLLSNKLLELVCKACGTIRRNNGIKLKTWNCKFCTLINSNGVDRCLACGEWRYSYGSHFSTYEPNAGT